jgi:hypothetical protein
MIKIWKFLCLILLLAACKEKGWVVYNKPDTAKVKDSDTTGWGKAIEEPKKTTEISNSDSIPETEAIDIAASDVVYNTLGSLNGFDIKHLNINIKSEGIYEVRLISNNPNLRFVFRENNIDSEANKAYWKGNIAKGSLHLKVFFNAEAALAEEKARYKFYILKL